MKSLSLLGACQLILEFVIAESGTSRQLQKSIHTNTQAHIPSTQKQGLFIPILAFILGMIVMFTARLIYDRFKAQKRPNIEPREVQSAQDLDDTIVMDQIELTEQEPA